VDDPGEELLVPEARRGRHDHLPIDEFDALHALGKGEELLLADEGGT
jgi:hypothetical protein